MAPLTALYNDKLSTDKIQLFHVTDQQNLGVALKTAEPDGDDYAKIYSASDSGQKGFIVAGSQIGSALFDTFHVVVAVTTQKRGSDNSDPKFHDVAIVSPVYKVIGQTDLDNKSVAIVSSKDNNQAWVYYLDGTIDGKVKIMEYDLASENPPTELDAKDVQLGSSLAAFVDDQGNRSVIFQRKKQNDLQEYLIGADDTLNVPHDGASAMHNTRLAVAKQGSEAWLYYTDEFHTLYRTCKTDKGWQTREKISSSIVPDAASHLAAVSAKKRVHVFFQASNNPKITHIQDFRKNNGENNTDK